MNTTVETKHLIYLGVALILATGWVTAEVVKSEGSRYSLDSGGALQRTFLLDKKSGKVWRYYLNTENGKPSGNPPYEGFQLIHE